MKRSIIILLQVIFLIVLTVSISTAYDIPPRKVEIKPYLNFLFPSDMWENEFLGNQIKNETSPGFGVKIRNQMFGPFGFQVDASYVNLEMQYSDLSAGVMFTVGGYYMKSVGQYNLIFDCGFGLMTAGDEGLGLLMPSVEINRSVSERISIALALGWPIPNDWLRNYQYDESYSSFTLSLGSNILF